MKKIHNPLMGKEGYDCFGCCPTNPFGVHMEFYEDGDYVVSIWKPQAHYQGWINTMHGGILATLIDETACWVVFDKIHTSGMTTQLDIHYKKAISTTEEFLTIRGHIVEKRHSLAYIDVSIQNAKGEICVEGKATFFCMKPEKAKEMGYEACDVEEQNDKSVTMPHDGSKKLSQIYFAGGCFWGTEHYFKQLRGVVETEVGYANGHAENPTYKDVCTDQTGFAETVRIAYDTSLITLEFLTEMYFKAIDPLSINKQGHDIGTQYRTGIYYTDVTDKPILEKVYQQVEKEIGKPLAVQLQSLENFYTAEDYHQDYLDKNPDGYCHLPAELFKMAKEANR